MLISAFLGAAAARPARLAAEAPARIGPGQTLPQIWRVGGKKGIFLQRNEAICCPTPFSVVGTSFQSQRRGV